MARDGGAGGDSGSDSATSPFDQAVASLLILVGAIVLIRRAENVTGLLKASWPIVLYFFSALFSLVWSDFPAWGFKRWMRGLGDLIMVLVLSRSPAGSCPKGLLSRVGFVLLPPSVLLIKYYPALGQGWDMGNHGFQFGSRNQ